MKKQAIEKINKKYQFTDDMQEISGFGGGYERACRDMVLAGLKWLDKNPDAELNFKTLKNVYGATSGETPDMIELQNIMEKAAASGGGATGAMMQACSGHVMFIHLNGWENYQKEMRRKDGKR